MENRNDILNELNALSPLLARMEKINVFTVPEGYFNCITADILACLPEKQNSFIKDNTVQPVYDIPAGYFDTLADTILSRLKKEDLEIAADELKQLSPMLYAIQNENVFKAPVGYFESLSDNVLIKLSTQPAKLVPMRRHSNDFFKYAAAAVFTGVMALGVFNFKSGSTKESILPDYVKAGMQIQDVDNEFSKLSELQIIKFLQANPENFDAQTVANKTLNENNIPGQLDYIMDDNALDNYLNNVSEQEVTNL